MGDAGLQPTAPAGRLRRIVVGVVFYNGLLALVGAATLSPAQRTQPIRALLAYLLTMLGLGLVFGFFFYQDEPFDSMFAIMRMWSYGLFLQLPLLSVGWAWLQRKENPKVARGVAAVGVLIAVVGIDAFFIEPTLLEVNEVTVVSKKVKTAFTIAVIADIQSDAIGDYERRALRLVMAAKPDLILFPGDYVQAPGVRAYKLNMALLHDMLIEEKIGARLGTFAVAGNVDNMVTWPQIFEGTGIETAFVTKTFHPNPDLSITGLTLNDSFDTKLKVEPQPGFHIVVGHGPDFALGEIDGDLLVAGHTHGGQVQIPFFGPPVTLSKVPRDWAHGMTAMNERQTLIVSRGVGLERGMAPRLRFWCRPEIVIVHVVPE